jgi:hypothetical protein
VVVAAVAWVVVGVRVVGVVVPLWAAVVDVVELDVVELDVVVEEDAAIGVKDVEHAAPPAVTLTTTVSPDGAVPTSNPVEPWPFASSSTDLGVLVVR